MCGGSGKSKPCDRADVIIVEQLPPGMSHCKDDSLPEEAVMPVDANRVRAVYLMAVEAADPAHQAAILDRECASDTDLRERVEALIRTHQDPASLSDQPAGTPLPPDEGTTELNRPTAANEIPVGTAKQDPPPAGASPKEDEGQISLEFLLPSTKPGSLGRLGHYEVMAVLGRGAFGIVVRAFDETLQRVVAIKVLSPQLASTSPARKRFLREARGAGRIRHENVVQIYAVEEQPIPYLVMEYVPSQTLQQRLDQTGPLEVQDVLRIGERIARGLAAAHEQGLIHRDIKPANILLENGIEQKVKITDFGLARTADDASVTQSGMIAGTPLYMAPEQARGESLDHRADLFSLGSVLYTMVSGRPPFRAATPLAVLKRVNEDTPRPIREIIPEVPQWLSDLIARLQAKDRARRFQSASEVADLLAQHLAHLLHPSLVARPVIGELPRQRRPLRVAVLAAAAVGLAVLGAVLTYPLWRPGESASGSPGPDEPGKGGGQAQKPAPGPAEHPPTGILRSLSVQGPDVVRDTLIHFEQPERNYSGEAQDNPLRSGEQCNAFLVRFDLTKLGLPPKVHVAKATVSFYVWDPSSQGKTKVCAFPLKTEWNEKTVTWRQPAAGKKWRGGENFAFDSDTGAAGEGVVVEPDQPGTDTVDPPIEYQLEVTDLVRSWLEGRAANYGLAIAPVSDRSVDEGILTRFQVFSSKHPRAQYTPKLTVQVSQ
jgi:serine/threonine protein kinase